MRSCNCLGIATSAHSDDKECMFGHADLKPLTERIALERKLMHTRAEALFPAAVTEWQQHFGAVLQGSPDWEVRGALGNRMLFVLRELLQLLPSWGNVRADVGSFLQAAHQASQASVSMIAGVQRSQMSP